MLMDVGVCWRPSWKLYVTPPWNWHLSCQSTVNQKLNNYSRNNMPQVFYTFSVFNVSRWRVPLVRHPMLPQQASLGPKLGEGQLIFWYSSHPHAFFRSQGDSKIKKNLKMTFLFLSRALNYIVGRKKKRSPFPFLFLTITAWINHFQDSLVIPYTPC